MPPPNQSSGNKPNDLRRRELFCNPDWQKDSGGRHHVFLFDGTWNDETGVNPSDFGWDAARQLWVSKDDPAKAYPPIITNVAKTYLALAPDSAAQITHYFRGVGNDDENDALNRLAEGMFASMEEHVRNAAYCEFLRCYQSGDIISILGFSRGAASARLFARDLGQRGLVSSVMAEDRYRSVRNNAQLRHDVWSIDTKWAKKPFLAGADLPIAFLGVWDTVPENVSAAASDWIVPAAVARAVHCVALDEFRVPFVPTLLQYPAKRASAMKEVWFPGGHCDVGGGYFNDALSRVTLDFTWKTWTNALATDGLPALAWKAEPAARYVDTRGLPWLRHQQELPNNIGRVAPREITAANNATPKVHPSVEAFVQHGGLQFCAEDGRFPPTCTISAPIYQPLAYPGAESVELYATTNW
ncbi:MAG: hypothetical protein JWM32_2738 [Verrucomicrobia bacterium]|nr:hypothetical protein [Verrucomicrobiota bacterium]